MLIIADASPLGKDILDNAQKVPTLNGDADSVPALEERIVPTEKDYIDAKIDGVRNELRADVAELRADVRSLDAKIDGMVAAINARFQAIDAKLESIPTTWQFVSGLAGGLVAAMGLFFAMMSYTGDREGAAALQQKQITETRLIADQNTRQISDLNNKLDRVLTALEKQQPPAPPQQ